MKPLNAVKTIDATLTILVVLGALLCTIFAGTLAWWAADRDAPFVMLDYQVAPARAGEDVVVSAVVRRDLSRSCSVRFSRAFYDSKGTRFELTEKQAMNSLALDKLQQRSPDTLVFGIAIPDAAQPGAASIVTSLDYSCNPMHQLWPIPMVLNMDVEVLP